MSLNQPFLSLDKSNKENCLLCDSSIANGVKQTNFTDKGWTTLKEQALCGRKSIFHLNYRSSPLRKFLRKLNLLAMLLGLLMPHVEQIFVPRFKRLLTDTA